jgi:hypothetical protein
MPDPLRSLVLLPIMTIHAAAILQGVPPHRKLPE